MSSDTPTTTVLMRTLVTLGALRSDLEKQHRSNLERLDKMEEEIVKSLENSKGAAPEAAPAAVSAAAPEAAGTPGPATPKKAAARRKPSTAKPRAAKVKADPRLTPADLNALREPYGELRNLAETREKKQSFSVAVVNFLRDIVTPEEMGESTSPKLDHVNPKHWSLLAEISVTCLTRWGEASEAEKPEIATLFIAVSEEMKAKHDV